MRPYLAVLKDAFREAFASFLLWLVLILVVGLLILLACFSVSDTLASDFVLHDIPNEQHLADKLIEEGESATPSAVKRIWEGFKGRPREQLKQFAGREGARPGEAFALRSILLNQLNEVLTSRTLYDSDAWKEAGLNEEARKYAERGVAALSTTELKRFNRLLIDAVLPFYVNPVGESQAKFMFLALEIPGTAGIPPRQLVAGVLVSVLRLVIGFGGLIICILVTSGTIPQMYEPGAIDLLLSKPVSRVLLFLTRFVGGCAFMLIIAVPLICGVWLISGVRLGQWYPKLFWCIPLFALLFMVYYAISAVAGVLWRNSIVSVILTAVFMGFCFGIETYHGLVSPFVFDHTRLAKLVVAGDTLMGFERNGTAYAWDQTSQKWTSIFKQRQPSPTDAITNFPYAGPVYEPKADRLAALEANGGFGQFGGSGRLVVGDRRDGWHTVDSIPSDFGVVSLFATPEGDLITVGSQGVKKFEGDPIVRPKQPFKVFGLDLSKMNAQQAEGPRWTEASADGQWQGPLAAAMANDGRLAVFARGTVMILGRENGTYKTLRERDLDTTESAFIAINGNVLAVLLADGKLLLLDATTLKTTHELKAFSDEKPRQLVLSADGKWLFAVTHERNLWAFDAQAGKPTDIPIRGPGGCFGRHAERRQAAGRDVLPAGHRVPAGGRGRSRGSTTLSCRRGSA